MGQVGFSNRYCNSWELSVCIRYSEGEVSWSLEEVSVGIGLRLKTSRRKLHLLVFAHAGE